MDSTSSETIARERASRTHRQVDVFSGHHPQVSRKTMVARAAGGPVISSMDGTRGARADSTASRWSSGTTAMPWSGAIRFSEVTGASLCRKPSVGYVNVMVTLKVNVWFFLSSMAPLKSANAEPLAPANRPVPLEIPQDSLDAPSFSTHCAKM
jgi:hypothetical protein